MDENISSWSDNTRGDYEHGILDSYQTLSRQDHLKRNLLHNPYKQDRLDQLIEDKKVPQRGVDQGVSKSDNYRTQKKT